MSDESTEPSAAYQEAVAQRAAIGHELFELMVKEEWYGMMTVALSRYDNVSPGGRVYYEEPVFDNTVDGSYHYLGCWEARRIKTVAMGEKLSDDQFKELVEDVIREELDKYNVELRWLNRQNWDGNDSVLRVYPKVLVQKESGDK